MARGGETGYRYNMYKNIYVTLLNIRVNWFGTAQKRLHVSRMFAGSRFSALVKT